MANPVSRRTSSREAMAAFRRETARRLRARREEICDAVIHRALSVAPPTGDELPGYVEALRQAIPEAVDHAFEVVEVGEERVGPIPAAIAAQAVASARSNVGLEVVMRRYAAGYSTVSDFLHQEVRALGADAGPAYSLLQRELTALFDRFVVEVSEVYGREEAPSQPSPRERRLERIRRLMAGDLIDPGGLDYPLDGLHLAAIVSGPDAGERAAELAKTLSKRLLRGEDSGRRSVIWLGGTRFPAREEIGAAWRATLGAEGRVAMGEVGKGLAGWRRTMRQAESAALVAERGGGMVVSYGEVALLSAALRDPDLAHFLTETYVEPLRGDRIELAETLITFLRLNGNASSAAAALGVSRHTVASRVRQAEERLGRRLEDCAATLETALRLAKIRH
jgi:PucR C-terminal helix-turn-helix domain/GGDEF-like domain